ncbi:MAG: phosphoketolase family protein [Pirellula sp.]|nr:phosphoketolase family protein [Pirellula sp.]
MLHGNLTTDEISQIDAYWRAANYLSVGQIYLLDNPLLREPLRAEHVKPRLLGHWGTTPGLNFIHAHLNRVIRRFDSNMIYICGPGHGGPAMVANAYLEGTYTETYPEISMDLDGVRKLFRQFSFPGGIPSHVAPETPGSIHEGGELGYALSHAFGAAFDNPDLIVTAIVGDGEAETGPLATGWHGNKFLNPRRDGAVLPILHLNGYKIANPTILSIIPEKELESLFRGLGYDPIFVSGHDPDEMHPKMANALDRAISTIHQVWRVARDGTAARVERPMWPVIILRTPKGWTCPPSIDGKVTEDSWRSHQVPMGDARKESHVRVLEGWLKSYRPEELFDSTGAVNASLRSLAPQGARRMSANPHANGGLLCRDLELPELSEFAIDVPSPGTGSIESTRIQGNYIAEVMKRNLSAANFRVFSPDENASNRWDALFEVTGRCLIDPVPANADHISQDGRVLEVLSEHQCQGWLEGYLLTGRHGFFNCYEAFIHIVDSMFNQHAKWLKVCREIPWRKSIPSLNYLLTSHVWRQDHNGFSHQDPGFIDHVANKKAEVIRIYLPPDANTLLCVTEHCLKSRDYVNVLVAGKQPALQYFDLEAARQHCRDGLGILKWASTDNGDKPDVVLGCCGDVPTMETLAAAHILLRQSPDIRIRVVNVVDLMRLESHTEHPHGLTDEQFDSYFPSHIPTIFAFHGYPSLIHQLTYRRKGHGNLHVRGYKEEGTTTTPFDMTVLNDLDRYRLVMDVLKRTPGAMDRYGQLHEEMLEARRQHRAYILEQGEDPVEIRNWSWVNCR